jgi:hypothetical protein
MLCSTDLWRYCCNRPRLTDTVAHDRDVYSDEEHIEHRHLDYGVLEIYERHSTYRVYHHNNTLTDALRNAFSFSTRNPRRRRRHPHRPPLHHQIAHPRASC